ncbi:uncharacterized mitochondrial protein AtMg00810-like [Cryptomeria japonica]|uniref:uncharacterized mitochondrial protein AtMg00810-like n=1 Tax=Cryptomeria japonica TaxID=3369 RepID=UPI0027DAA8D2|nr:uncharacterized mitochondrial protein AtMg00810-like [Cryptomeria japonica]
MEDHPKEQGEEEELKEESENEEQDNFETPSKTPSKSPLKTSSKTPSKFVQKNHPEGLVIDDIIFGGSKNQMCEEFASNMQKEFEMSMLGEISFFLGLQISQSDKGIFLSQTKYVREMLKGFRFEDCHPISTPMVTGCKLSKNDESPDANQTQYRSMIGSLLYVTTTRLDIMQAVGVATWYQAAPKKTHVQVVKRIFKYLKGTMDFGLWYPKCDDFTLRAYTNVDWAGDKDDSKSTSGGAFLLGNNLVSWLSKK